MTERIFQEYEGFTVEFMPNSHRYALTVGDERKPAVSVTSALGILSKPQLMAWYGRQDSEAILELEREDQLRGLSVGECHDVMRGMGLGAEAKREEGAARGTAVHDALEQYCENAIVPSISGYDAEVKGYVSGLCDWLFEASPEPILVEQIVGSPRYNVAGRFDLIANIDGKRTLCDLKSSRNAGDYPESHLQMAGYRLMLPECGIEDVEQSLIIEVSDDGSHRAVPAIGDAGEFLLVLYCHRAYGDLKGRLRAAKKAQLALDA